MTESLKQFEGKYELLEKIAEGGMGAVYKVQHRLLDEVRVIKVMRPQIEDQEQSKSRFMREARIAVKVRHENIAQMYDFSVDEAGAAFIVMEFIDGVTLQRLLKQVGPPSVALSLDIAQQSLNALQYLHRKGIVHRDISPDNLMLARDETGEPLVKLIDLGIAKLAQGGGKLTATGMFLGKVRYASPEHFKVKEGVKVDFRSDIYSFGLVLYELLTGTHPIVGKGWSEMIAGHLFRPPLDFAQTDPEHRVPDELREIVLHALAKSTEDRFQDAKSFRAQIAKLQEDHPPVSEEELEQVLSASRGAAAAPPPARRVEAEEDAGAAQAPEPKTMVDRVAQRARAEQEVSEVEEAEEAAKPEPELEHKVDELIHSAERLLELDLFTEARAQLDMVLDIDPGNELVQALQSRIEEGERRRATLARIEEAVGPLIEEGKFDDAAARIDEAIAEVGDASALTSLRDRIAQLRDAQRAASIRSLLDEGRRHLEEGELQQAVAAFDRLFELDPEHAEAATLRLEAQHRLAPPAPPRVSRVTTAKHRVITADEAEPAAADRAPPPPREAEEQPLPPPPAPPPVSAPTPPVPAERPAPEAPAPPTAVERPARRGPPAVVWAAAAAAVLLVIVVSLVLVLTRERPQAGAEGVTTEAAEGAAAATGTLIIDALPWGEVVEVADDTGSPLALPEDRFTPLSLTLPAGRYQISLRSTDHPEPVVVDAEVKAGEISRRVERLNQLDARELLGRYGL